MSAERGLAVVLRLRPQKRQLRRRLQIETIVASYKSRPGCCERLLVTAGWVSGKGGRAQALTMRRATLSGIFRINSRRNCNRRRQTPGAWYMQREPAPGHPSEWRSRARCLIH
jgi:hypothetical protein